MYILVHRNILKISLSCILFIGCVGFTDGKDMKLKTKLAKTKLRFLHLQPKNEMKR